MDLQRIVNDSVAVLLAVVFILFVAISAYSQVTGATLSGTITDSSGGVIPGAQIFVTNTATGIRQEFQADSAGYYIGIHRISETFNVQFRSEIFNILNHSNFIPPEPLTGASLFDATGAPFKQRISGRPGDTTTRCSVCVKK